MTALTARFKQAPPETRRYIIDYTLGLNPSEQVIGVVPSITSPTGDNPANFTIASIVLISGGLQVAFFASGGVNGQSYEVRLLATTSIGQILEDVAQFDIQDKV